MSEQNPYAAPESNLKVDGDGESVLATKGARFGGAVIDGVISILALFPILYLTGFWDTAMSVEPGLSQLLMMGVLAVVLFFVIHGYFLAKYGQTVGKKVVGTRIVSVKTEQILPLSKIFLLRVLPINIVVNIPIVGALLALIDILFIFRKDRRCVHDLIAGTKVIKV